MNFQESIIQGIQLAFQNIFNHDLPIGQISLAPTKKEFVGSYTFVVFPFLKVSQTTPENTGNLIGEYLKTNVPAVSDFNVVKGFLNLVLNERVWLDLF
ncbi:MAG: hypothetical protein O9264_03475, partial [Leptospira sp.]|nr:hypothetical protein [Leptospira sp.]